MVTRACCPRASLARLAETRGGLGGAGGRRFARDDPMLGIRGNVTLYSRRNSRRAASRGEPMSTGFRPLGTSPTRHRRRGPVTDRADRASVARADRLAGLLADPLSSLATTTLPRSRDEEARGGGGVARDVAATPAR